MKVIKCDNGNIAVILKENQNVSDKMIRCNSIDASFEKHVPQVEFKNDKVLVFVNHVMEEDHYIEWIMVDYGNRQIIKHFVPGDRPEILVDYEDDMKVFSYCNKHGLWLNDEIYKK